MKMEGADDFCHRPRQILFLMSTATNDGAVFVRRAQAGLSPHLHEAIMPARHLNIT